MRINHNISSMITQGALFQVNREQSKTLEKLSTGLRINRASDDAAGLSISENLRTQVIGLGVAKANAQDGIALLQIAEGGLNEISVILQRMRELAVQSANDTLTSVERAYTNQEYDALMSEIDRISNTTVYNKQSLLIGSTTAFGGTSSSSSILHIGPNDDTSYDEVTISIDTMTTDSAGMNLSGTYLTTHNSAITAIASIDDSIDAVNAERSDLGAYVNRLEHAINNIINQEHNNQAAEAFIRDTDFAIETSRFTRNSILMQSATAMLAQANLVPQSVLGLLGR